MYKVHIIFVTFFGQVRTGLVRQCQKRLIQGMGVFLPSGVFRGIRLVTTLSGELKVKIC